MTLRDASQKKHEIPRERRSVAVLFAWPRLGLRAHLSSGTEFEFPREL